MSVAAREHLAVDREQLNLRIDDINRMMRTHAGAVELVDVSETGRVTVRFVAMCQGCPFRSVTMMGLVAPYLEELPGVAEVRAQGVRISDEAAERAAAIIGGGSAWMAVSLGKEGR